MENNDRELDHTFAPPPKGSRFGINFGGACCYYHPDLNLVCGYPEAAHNRDYGASVDTEDGTVLPS